MGLAFAFLFALTAFAQSSLDLAVPAGKIAKLRQYVEVQDGNVRRQALVGRHLIPEASGVRIVVSEPLLYRWLLQDDGKVVQSSMPYFRMSVLSLPDTYLGEDREQILAGEFFIHIRDLDAAQVIAAIFTDPLPEGVPRVSWPLAWDAFNPQGSWAHSVQKGLRVPANKFLVKKAPRDIIDFCPRFESLAESDRELFWIALFNEISKFESAHIPLTASDEGRYDPANKGIISTGLTQISLASSRAACYQARGCQLVRNQADLFVPDRGLRCSVGIMSCLAEAGGCLSCKKGGSWQGIARYWSTMRDPYEINCPTCPGGKITIGKKKLIQESLKSTASFCH